MNTNTINETTITEAAVSEEQYPLQRETKASEVCFGVLMTVASLYGIWCVASFLINYALSG